MKPQLKAAFMQACFKLYFIAIAIHNIGGERFPRQRVCIIKLTDARDSVSDLVAFRSTGHVDTQMLPLTSAATPPAKGGAPRVLPQCAGFDQAADMPTDESGFFGVDHYFSYIARTTVVDKGGPPVSKLPDSGAAGAQSLKGYRFDHPLILTERPLFSRKRDTIT